jgi:hypothetical protein
MKEVYTNVAIDSRNNIFHSQQHDWFVFTWVYGEWWNNLFHCLYLSMGNDFFSFWAWAWLIYLYLSIGNDGLNSRMQLSMMTFFVIMANDQYFYLWLMTDNIFYGEVVCLVIDCRKWMVLFQLFERGRSSTRLGCYCQRVASPIIFFYINISVTHRARKDWVRVTAWVELRSILPCRYKGRCPAGNPHLMHSFA